MAREKTDKAARRELVPIDADDRGPAIFFHGRYRELKDFQTALERASTEKGGTTFLVEGPPGAGKTALMHECAKLAFAEKWRVASISRSALHSPKVLSEKLNEPYPYRITDFVRGGAEIGVEVGLKMSVGGGAEKSREYSGDSVQVVLKKAAAKKGLLLVLDEAQNLDHTSQLSMEVRESLIGCLEEIHNGKIGAPVILLVGGLGTTSQLFHSFGISRWMAYGLHELGVLEREAADTVIRDWLVKTGGAQATDPNLNQWINSLAARSQRWPQHTQVCGRFAAEWLLANEHQLTAQVPADVWSKIDREKTRYCFQRVDDFAPRIRRVLARLLLSKEKGSSMERGEVIAALTAHTPGDKAATTFNLLLHRGVLAKTRDGCFAVPIPSMHDWLVGRYATAV